MKSWNSFACCSAVMPMPVSATASSTQSRPSAHLAHPQGDLALFRELTGIAQQIEQNLLQPHGIHGQGVEILSASTTSRFWFCWASCLAVPTTYSISGAFSARLTRDARQGGGARTGQRLRYA